MTAQTTTDPLLRTTTQRLPPLGLLDEVEYPDGTTKSTAYVGTSPADEASRFVRT